VIAVVGKNVFKKAADRNLLKRRLRVLLAPEARARQTDIIVTAKGKGDNIIFTEIKGKLSGALKKNGNNF
jgi:ribonuclease P protein component